MRGRTLTDVLIKADAAARDACGESMVKLRAETEAKWLRRVKRAVATCRKHLDAADRMIDSGHPPTVFESKSGKECRKTRP